jgi:hypothetical protein
MATATESRTEWLRANTLSPGIGVDREQKRINGYIVAQEGQFKTQGRGQFDLASLKKIKALMNQAPKGLKSRFTHPNLSSDGLGKFLGRLENPRMDVLRLMRGGKPVLLHAVRADLQLDDSSFSTPSGDLGTYVLDLAENDPDAFSSSLVLTADQEEQLDPKTKQPLRDEGGNPLPPIWRPKVLHASDIVDTGEAVDGLLSIDGLPDAMVREATALLNSHCQGLDRETAKRTLYGFADRYLSTKYGDPEEEASEDDTAVDDEKPAAKLGMSRSVAELEVILAQNRKA